MKLIKKIKLFNKINNAIENCLQLIKYNHKFIDEFHDIIDKFIEIEPNFRGIFNDIKEILK